MTSPGASIESLPGIPSKKTGASLRTSSRRGVAPEELFFFQYFSALAGSASFHNRRGVENSRLLPRPGREVEDVSSRSALSYA